MLGLVKVAVVIAVIAVVGGFATHWVKDKASSTFHHAIDTSLTQKVQAHAWAPVSHGKPVGDAKVRFADGEVTSLHCHAVLGGYHVEIDHHFSFDKAATPVKAGCPGRQLRTALSHATRVDVATQGAVERMTFSNADGHVVATLQAHSPS
jgi:hypothetical protein